MPADEAGHVSEHFADQARLVWRNVFARLRRRRDDAGLPVKVTMFLSDRRYCDENAAVRREMLGARTPALTVIITGIFSEQWLLERHRSSA